MIEPEEIYLSRRIGSYRLVTIEHVLNEVETFPLRQVLRPLDESDGAEGEEGRTRLKIPGFGFGVCAKNTKSVRSARKSYFSGVRWRLV